MVQEGGTTYTISDVQADQEIHVTFRTIRFKIIAIAGPNGSSEVVVGFKGDVFFMAIGPEAARRIIGLKSALLRFLNLDPFQWFHGF